MSKYHKRPGRTAKQGRQASALSRQKPIKDPLESLFIHIVNNLISQGAPRAMAERMAHSQVYKGGK